MPKYVGAFKVFFPGKLEEIVSLDQDAVYKVLNVCKYCYLLIFFYLDVDAVVDHILS